MRLKMATGAMAPEIILTNTTMATRERAFAGTVQGTGGVTTIYSPLVVGDVHLSKPDYQRATGPARPGRAARYRTTDRSFKEGWPGGRRDGGDFPEPRRLRPSPAPFAPTGS